MIFLCEFLANKEKTRNILIRKIVREILLLVFNSTGSVLHGSYMYHELRKILRVLLKKSHEIK